ncbi:uncharacterized protein LOC108487997 [Gossypium arboreum]|uniref:uncharacterized protein LOC108487997 n=1 Tax=Gossypium arboreum TaxID=29729 RepID=UPI00081951ED|nr:uncharacterized protein LOC108487997 [Gossypium arboreum]
MACSPEDYLRCAISLLKEEACNWWETVEAVVPTEKLTWEFFQNELKKKYVRKRYLDKKKREFLDLRQGNRTVAEYEREFVYLSKYAWDIVSIEKEMCIKFKEGLNDKIRMMVGGLEIREFVALSDRAQKMEEVYNSKMQRERRSSESYKRSSSKSFSTFPVKKFRDESSRPTSTLERSSKSRTTQRNMGEINKPVASASSVQNASRSRCRYCGKFHLGECWSKIGACYKCGSTNHLIRDCPQLMKEEREQKEKQEITSPTSKHSGQSSSIRTTHPEKKDSVARFETRIPARTYAIRVREKAYAPDVIASTLYLFDDSEFDIILGMDWLTKHDAVVNFRDKHISLKCQTGDIISFGSKNMSDTVRIISALSAQKLLRKGNEAFLAYIFDTRGSDLKLEQVPVVNKFPDVFPEELPGLAPDREVEFVIDVIP